MKGYKTVLMMVVLFSLFLFSTAHAAPDDRFTGGVNDGYANSSSLDISLFEHSQGTVMFICDAGLREPYLFLQDFASLSSALCWWRRPGAS